MFQKFPIRTLLNQDVSAKTTSRFLAASMLFVASLPAACSAHYLWIAAGSQTSDGKVHVYFSERVEPDDPDLLDKVTALKLWQISKEGSANELKTRKGTESLVADPVPIEGATFVLNHDYGVITRGNETFLLKYHAKCEPSPSPGNWRTISNPEQLPLEISARREGAETALTVVFQGKPLADAVVTVTGPGIESKIEATTNPDGEVAYKWKTAGIYSIRARHTEKIAGEFEGNSYASIRHYSTLSLTISEPPATTSTDSTGTHSTLNLPVLDPGLTSFGAAMIGDDLYLYGGHFGKPHHYSIEGQSNQLLKLNLKDPAGWDVVSTGPRRTGLAAVSHGGKFYRIGGFEAQNPDGEKQSLWSTSDFACYDPATHQWTELTPLPAGRSSHDAVVVGDTLYVIGGWELHGEGNVKWHETAYSVDLTAPVPAWKELPTPPFRRRALSLGEWQSKVYVIGGMQSEGGVTTATAIFDPEHSRWSEGPKLNGESMEGFGSSAFLCADKLCVTTFAGNVQVLAGDGSRWVNTSRLTFPRFFHRMLPWSDGRAVIVGGASMQTGKIRELETITIGWDATSGD
jgi:uncharacterized GH25 family protein